MHPFKRNKRPPSHEASQFRNLIDIFCSTSVLSSTLANSSNDIRSSCDKNVQFSIDKRELYHLVEVGLHDRPLRDGDELLGGDVAPHHHGQHSKQLLLADLVVAVKIVHPEREVELLHSGVQLVLLSALLDWTEVGEDSDKILEVHLVLISASALKEECVDNSVTERVDG